MLQENEHCKKELPKQGTNAGFCQQSEKNLITQYNVLASS